MKSPKPAKRPEKPSFATLAKALGFTPTAVRGWARRPDAPAGFDVSEWTDYILENGLGVVGNRVSPDRERTLAAISVEQLKSWKMRNARDAKLYVLRSDVAAMHFRAARLMQLRLYTSLERELPGRAVGRTADEISAVGRAIADELVDIFRQEESTWNNDNL